MNRNKLKFKIKNCFTNIYFSDFSYQNSIGSKIFEFLNDNVKKSFNRTIIFIDLNLKSFLNFNIDDLNKEKKNYNFYYLKLSEEDKNLKTITKLYSILLEKEIDKKDLILSIGGGLFSDLIGFAATTFKRGIPFIFIPTTLLSMIDASFGGKNGVNFNDIKNLIGTINQPKAILIFPEFLNNLSKLDFLSGLGELLKYLLIDSKFYHTFLSSFDRYIKKNNLENWDKDFKYKLKYNFKNNLEDNLEDIKKIFLNYPEFLFKALMIKYRYIKNDIFDNDKRMILNLGHTISHGLELQFNLNHGTALLAGLFLELKIASELFQNTDKIFKKANLIYKKLNLPFSLNDIIKIEKKMELKDFLINLNINQQTIIDRIIYTIHKDKKNQQNYYLLPVIFNNKKIEIKKIDFDKFDNLLKKFLI